MENLDVMVLRTLLEWRQQGLKAVLVTVVRTWGSSPRPIGSIMALSENGSTVGSVSGGCLEDDLILRFGSSSDIQDGPPELIKYGVTADEAHQFGLPCGGTVELFLEFNPEISALAELVAELDAGHLMQRKVRLADGKVMLRRATAPTPLLLDNDLLISCFGPEYRMLIIGGGQLSEYLATMALFCGFEVTVCDPRINADKRWSIPQAKLTTLMPDDAVDQFRPDARTSIVALTHDPKLDDLALLQALESNAFYVGGIGSRRNNKARKERMIAHFDQTEASLARLRGPIGVYIGSKTPAEIAVSVMAEILAVKNSVFLHQTADVAYAKNIEAEKVF
ncbi:XdhC family protein [Advenella sp. WQ 585]|uniref:XdhC family protein n=1 Tax=Advenella mandrilli TaxID=2800330 RepID=A0ABS1EH01_9BURK|nr:XdhC family protein [Advenella mandrilli]MBK1782313.1 XdhC family protein [Advenella mandrilli]